MSGKDRQRPIDLLRHYDPCQLMGQRHLSQGEQQVGALERGRRPAIRWAYRHHQPLAPPIAQVAQAGGKLPGRELLTAAFQQDDVCRTTTSLLRQPVQKPGLVLEDMGLGWQIAAAALYIVREQAIGRFGLGPSTPRCDGTKNDFHEIAISPKTTSMKT